MEEKIAPYLEELNEKQREAVLKTEGPLLILAGAGAGKTKTITHRILHLIKRGARPSSILAITFTNKAAKEMRERTRKLIREDSLLNLPVSSEEEPFISTFHSLGVHIVRNDCHMLSLPRMFNIFDRDDSKKAIKTAMENRGIDPKQFEPSKILSAISKQKGEGVFFEEWAISENRNYFEEVVGVVWEEYEKILEKEKALDFDDLLLKSLRLLRKPEIAAKYHGTWKYIHIDEYQDTNRVQYDIAKILASKEKNIAVVGDIDQSIYSWRGADFKNIIRFEKDYDNAETILLEENYRSTKNILAVANAIIAKNKMRKEKNLFTNNAEGDLISLYIAFDEREEGYYIAKTARMLIDQGVDPEEIAVLYRANFQSRAIEEAFLKTETPYDLIGTKFFERKEVKDAISYLKLAMNPESLSDFKRIVNTPPRGIGKVTLLKILEGKGEELTGGVREKIDKLKNLLKEIAQKSKSMKPSALMKFIISASGLENMYKDGKEEDVDRLENIRELVTIATSFDIYPEDTGIEKFLEHVALQSDQDELDKKRKGVKLMTVHASKGLEFEYVFITGLEEDLFPHKAPEEKDMSNEDSEEERRIFYVALTRARKKIYLTYSSVRTIYGSKQVTSPSEFISDIDNDFLNHENSGFGKIMQYIDW